MSSVRRFVLGVLVGWMVCMVAAAGVDDDLAAYYPFDGSAVDESGNGHHGVPANPTPAEDRFGRAESAYAFDGNDTVNLTGSRPIRGVQNEFSVSVWVFPTASKPNKARIYMHRAHWRDVSILWVQESATVGRPYWGITVPSVKHFLGAGEHSVGAWYHIVGTYDGQTQKIYVNGELAGSETWAGQIDWDAAFSAERIGGDGTTPTEQFEGRIDDVRFYTRALSAEDVVALYEERPPVEFDEFAIRQATIHFGNTVGSDWAHVSGSFELGETSNGANPVTEVVGLGVGSLWIEIPAGSFRSRRKRSCFFRGTIDGCTVAMHFVRRAEERYSVQAFVWDADLSGSANPLMIELAVGDDVGILAHRLRGTLNASSRTRPGP